MIPYSLHVAFLIMVSLLFYKLMLKKETYHTLNRIVLLICLSLSFLLPFAPVPQKFSFVKDSVVASSTISTGTSDKTVTKALSKPRPVLQQQTPARQTTSQLNETLTGIFNAQNILNLGFWAYWCGVMIFGINLLIQLIVIAFKIFKSEAIHDGRFRIVELNDDKAPCSFGRYIFINPAKYDWDTYNQILTHEKVHARQYHTLDIVVAELMVVFQWFNPLAWIYRKEIENNLEFLTDRTVVDRYEVKQDEYQLNLLKVCVPNFSMRITTNYNQSLLKQRIMMMNSRRSNIHVIWKYFAMAPLFIAMVCLLNKPVAVSAAITRQLPKDTTDKKNNMLQSNKKLVAAKKTKIRKTVNQFVRNGFGERNILKNSVNDRVAVSNVLVAQTNINTDQKPLKADDIITLQTSGVTSGYIQGIGASAFKNFTVDNIIDLQQHGITTGYILGIGASGFTNFKANDIIDLQQHGITTGYVQGIGAAGFRKFTANNIIDLQQHGLTTGYIQGIGAAGFRNFTADNIIDLQQHGITTGYIQGIGAAGYKNFTVNDIITLQEHGITSGYIQGIGASAYKNMSASDIIKLQEHGITVGYVKGTSN